MKPDDADGRSVAAVSLRRGAFDLRRFGSDAVLVVGAAGLGNLFSYAFHFALSRRLGPDLYGSLVTLTSIAGMLGVIGVSLGTVAMQEAATLWTRHLDEAIGAFVRRTGRYVVWIATATGIAVVLSSIPLGSYVHVRQPGLWALLALYVAIFMLAGYARGAAQGAHRFGAVAASFVGEGLAKVGVALALVGIGLGIVGAVVGLIASAIVAVSAAIFPFLGHDPAVATVGEQTRLGRSALRVLGVGVAVNVLLFMDMIFAKHHFAGSVAGYFGAAGTVARTIPFAISLVALIVMPKAAAAQHTGRDSLARVLGSSAAVAATVIVAGLVVVVSLASQIIAVTYGSAFANAAGLMRLYGVDEALLALWATAVSYLVAVARYAAFGWLAVAVVIEAIGMALLGSDPVRLLSIGIVVNAALVPVMWTLAVRTLGAVAQAAQPPRAENPA